MRKLTVILLAIATTTLMFNTCGKYEEGPDFSLRTKTARITGTWEMKEMSVNGEVVDIEEIFSLALEEFDGEMFDLVTNIRIKYKLEKDGSGEIIFYGNILGLEQSFPQDIEWKFDDNKEKIMIFIENEWEDFEIIRLTNNELWLRDTEVENEQTITVVIKFEKE
jgi:hypothetical protein